jgi:DNA helicase II / ATP-dependent DNA helicase PcrA
VGVRGSTAHAAFEAFTKERRERAARGDPPPTREDLGQLFAAEWKPTGFPDATSEQTYRRRTATLLDNFWDGELASVGTALHEELGFVLRLDPGDGTPVVRIGGFIDRIDRLPSGAVEVLDYKTGKPGTQKTVDESLQLSIYALACRDELGLGTPERVTLYYTEAATHEELLALAAQVRSGDFHATPSPRTCGWFDYRAICPSRAE